MNDVYNFLNEEMTTDAKLTKENDVIIDKHTYKYSIDIAADSISELAEQIIDMLSCMYSITDINFFYFNLGQLVRDTCIDYYFFKLNNQYYMCSAL